MNNSKKGFTLIELLVTLVIVAVLGTLLFPTFQGHFEKTTIKQDEAALETLRTTVQNAFQNNNVYKNAKKIAAHNKNNQLVLRFTKKSDSNQLSNPVLYIDANGAIYSSDRADDLINTDLKNILTSVNDKINGTMDPVVIESEEYMKKSVYEYIVTFKDMEFKVDVDMKIIG